MTLHLGAETPLDLGKLAAYQLTPEGKLIARFEPHPDVLRDALRSCIHVCMRTTLDLDEKLVQDAIKESGAKTKTEVIEMGLRLLLEREARRRLKALRGRLPELAEAPRRRRA